MIATLPLRSQPVITLHPQSQTNAVGADVTLSVAVQGTPPFGYQWRAFPTSNTFTNIPGASEPTLRLSNLQTSGYRFGVVVTNSQGATTSQLARIIVVYPPAIIDPPLAQFSWTGHFVSMTVSFTNSSAGMKYRWQWEGEDLPSKTNLTFTIPKAQLKDAGNYQIIVSNLAGSVTSAIARLTIKTMPPATGVSFLNLTNLEKTITSMMLDHQIPAASLAVMKDGRLLAARCYGYADPESNEHTEPDSIFRIASMTKAIVATVALKLAEQGKLSLDDYVFPKMNIHPVDPRLNNIRLRQLLNHTAGWDPNTAINPDGGTGFNPVTWVSRCAKDLGIADRLKVTPRDMARWLAGFPLQNNPGDVFVYSNGGYIVASGYLEHIAGMTFESLVRSVLAPADITRLRVESPNRADRRPDEVVQWLHPAFDIRTSEEEYPTSVTADLAYYYPQAASVGSGGISITPLDYTRFVGAIDGLSHPLDILTPGSISTMLTPTQQSVAGGEPYGMGWDIGPAVGEFSHGGGSFATATQVVRRPDGSVYVLFTNTNDKIADLLGLLESGALTLKNWPTNDLFQATMSYEAWQRRYFTNEELSQNALSGDDSDPDRDGFSNLVEYAAGAAPRTPTLHPWVRLRTAAAGDSSSLTLEYRRRPLGHAVHYAVETSVDLVTWEASTVTSAEQVQSDGMLLVSMPITPTSKPSAARFYRIKVTKAHPEF